MSGIQTQAWIRFSALAAVVGAASSIGLADEDLRKLKDAQPPVYHGGYVGGVWGAGPDQEFESQNVRLMSWLPLNLFPGNHTSGNTCWGYVSPSGREYALMGLQRGTGIVEVTDPVNPVIIDVVTGPTSTWRDMKVIGDYAYAVSEGGWGIQVIDLRRVDEGIVRHVGNIQQNGHTSTHTIASNTDSGFLYLCGARVGNDGLVAVSTANPENPTIVGAWSGMYVHEAQVVTYHTGPYAGREIAFCYSGNLPSGFSNGGLRIIDVTDKSNMHLIGQMFWPNTGYSHQGWLSEDRKFIYLNDELDEQNFGFTTRTHVVNVEDLTNPYYVGFFTNGNTAIDHNLYVVGTRIYQANYRSGLQIYDTAAPGATPEQPVRIGFFDTYPGSDAAQFNGAWNNYPFFPSGNILISDIERGLFVVRYDTETMTINLVGSAPTLLTPNVATPVAVEVVAGGGAEIDTVTLNVVIDGGSPQAIAMAPQGGDVYGANLPGTACRSVVDFWFTVETVSGGRFAYPSGGQANAYSAFVATGFTQVFHDDFSTNRGWIIGAHDDDAVRGIWNRMVPQQTQSGGNIAQPGSTPTGTACMVTDGRAGTSVGAWDVDEGKTTLFSPVLNVAGMDPTVSYYRWFSNHVGANPGVDIFVIDVSNDGGQTWTNVETVGPTGPESRGGWYQVQHRIADFVPPSGQVQFRFVASDLGPQAIVEALIDDFKVEEIDCAAACYADCDQTTGPGVLDIFDFLCFGNKFDQRDPYACDCDLSTGPGVCDIFDFLCFGNAFSQGCP